MHDRLRDAEGERDGRSGSLAEKRSGKESLTSKSNQQRHGVSLPSPQFRHPHGPEKFD